MGENKIDQQVGQPNNTDLQQTYGSQKEGRHNREGASAMHNEDHEEETNNPSMIQQNRMNPKDPGSLETKDDSYDYEKEDDQYDQGRFYTRSQLNEMQYDSNIATVEGDDKDILGETENSQRNQQHSTGEFNQGNTQNR
ncbi:MAG: hypothetical protein ACM3RX_05665 [Methanococcaceae archaeon]